MTPAGLPSGPLTPYSVLLFQRAGWSLATLWLDESYTPRGRKAEKLKNLSGSSRKDTHLKVQMVLHVMSAPDHIL